MFNHSDFMEHGCCLLWNPALVGLHVISDIITGLAYYFIAIAIFYFIVKRRDLPFLIIFLLFGVFILACGTTHIFAAYTIYVPIYWEEGIVKAVTAVVSTIAAIKFIPLMPKAIALPGLPKALEEIKDLNKVLENQVEELTIKDMAIASSTNAIAFYDLDGRLTFVNNAFLKLWGYDNKEEVIEKFFTEFWESEGRALAVFDALRKNGNWTGELTAKGKDGRAFTSEVILSMVLGKSETPVGFMGIFVDITERKLAEQALTVREQRYRTLVESIPDLIIRYDTDLRRIYVNPAWEKASGMSAGDVIGTRPADISKVPNPSAEDEYAEKLRQVLETGTPQSIEFTWVNADGVKLFLEYAIVPEYDEYGKVAGLLSIGHDLTQRKRLEDKLSLLNRELRAISNCNQALMRAEDEQTLLNDICRIVCEDAGYRMAWVGYAEDDADKTVRPVAWAGFEEGYLKQARITWADTERGRGPTGTAARTGETIYQDFLTDPRLTLWRDSALQRGLRVSIALPLKDEDDKVFGVFTVYSSEPDAFMPEEILLLEELAGDLAFGITVLRSKIERKRLEKDYLDHLHFLESMDKVNRAIQGTNDFERMTSDVLDIVLSIFDCDRAFLMYPCDPEAESWHCPMERTRPEYPGVLTLGLLIPMDTDVAKSLRIMLDSDGPVKFGPGTPNPLPGEVSERFGFKCCMSMAIYPKVGKPWQFGIHQCSYPREWTAEEERLLQEIGRRLSDALTGVLVTRNLRESEEMLRRLNEELEERVRDRTEELEKANIRLQEVDRLKSMFIASMSHELRTPLNSIIGFSSVLLNEWAGPMNSEQKENMATIVRSGEHLLSLINDVIDVSKIEAGNLESTIDDFDIYEVVAEAVSTLENDIRKKGIEFKVMGIHQAMQTDKRRLLQCLLNLMSNAVKFTEKGVIEVRATIQCDGDMMEISVSDTGIGIKEEDMLKLFSPFVRLDSPLRSKVLGTGLGLYLTNKLVREVLKGGITVSSTYGEGSVFTLKVPITGLRST